MFCKKIFYLIKRKNYELDTNIAKVKKIPEQELKMLLIGELSDSTENIVSIENMNEQPVKIIRFGVVDFYGRTLNSITQKALQKEKTGSINEITHLLHEIENLPELTPTEHKSFTEAGWNYEKLTLITNKKLNPFNAPYIESKLAEINHAIKVEATKNNLSSQRNIILGVSKEDEDLNLKLNKYRLMFDLYRQILQKKSYLLDDVATILTNELLRVHSLRHKK